MAHHIPYQLIDAARTGGAAEAERLLEALWPDAYRLAYSVLGQKEAAEDAAQEACAIIYVAISSLRSTAAFRVWFYRIVVRAAMDVKRSTVQPGTASVGAQESDRTAIIDLWRALENLPPKLRTVIALRYFDDLSSREIASILHVPSGTVRFRLALARQSLRSLLGDAPTHFEPNEARVNAI